MGNRNFRYKVDESLVRIFILQRVALPLSLPALFLLIYDKPDLVFLSRSSLLAACAHLFPHQRSSLHPDLDIRTAFIPPRRYRQASLVLLFFNYLTPLSSSPFYPMG